MPVVDSIQCTLVSIPPLLCFLWVISVYQHTRNLAILGEDTFTIPHYSSFPSLMQQNYINFFQT